MHLPIAPLPKSSRTTRQSKWPFGWLFALAMVCFLGVFYWSTTPDFLEFDDDGNPALSPERLGKLGKELDELEHAEQYVLLANKDGYYPCYNCGDKMTIFLEENMIWKYGVTRKGEKGRYGDWHRTNHLVYVTEYQGQLQECLRREKVKIYRYGLHPENLSRAVPLIRPPGNKQDN